ncbi:RING finger protein [Abeliophyllum distichum]|uniref:RING finger protein n=1 Tax=Abeliophyllum distichum TaxID=126358 RepID=A0ABD1U431_9LAMI
MTMFSAENIFKHQFCGNYSEGFGVMSSQVQGYDSCSEPCLGSDRLVGPLMAEDQSRTGSVNEEGSSSKDVQQEKDEGWLQLSIGGYTGGHRRENNRDQADQSSRILGGPGLVELELLPTSSGNTSQIRPLAPMLNVPEFAAPRPVMNFSTASDHGTLVFLQHPGTSSTFPYHQEINWAYRPIPINITSPSTSSTSLMAPGSYFPRGPLQVHPGIDIPGPSLDFRVIQPPRRPHSGIWFILEASQNQAKEPFLPQISKSYLRIKDGRMTIRLVKKYLVNKLRLENESEIEITCKGQELLPFLTLQHVRDNIWSQRDFVTLLPNSSSATADHIMVLFYGRSASN